LPRLPQSPPGTLPDLPPDTLPRWPAEPPASSVPMAVRPGAARKIGHAAERVETDRMSGAGLASSSWFPASPIGATGAKPLSLPWRLRRQLSCPSNPIRLMRGLTPEKLMITTEKNNRNPERVCRAPRIYYRRYRPLVKVYYEPADNTNMPPQSRPGSVVRRRRASGPGLQEAVQMSGACPRPGL